MRIFKDIWTYFGQSQPMFIRVLHLMVILHIILWARSTSR